MTREDSPPAGDFYSHAIERIQRIMIVISLAALVTSQIYFGWRVALGVFVGSAISYANFHWLKKVAADVADLAAPTGTPATTRGTIMRFLVRYFLMALLGFVILTVSREGLYGFFAGLLVTVAALLCEAAYEAYKTVAGGFSRQ